MTIELLRKYSGIFCAICYITGFVMIIAIAPNINVDPIKRFEFILQHGTILQLWYAIIFIAFGFFLFLFNSAIQKTYHCDGTKIGQIAIILGYIWSSYIVACGLICIVSIEFILQLPGDQQKNVWLDIYAMQMGIGEGIEWIGGLWMIIIHTHIYLLNNASKTLIYFGWLIGLLGLLTIVPKLSDAGALFGILQIFWFVKISLSTEKQAEF